MRTNYKKIQLALEELDNARNKYNRLTSAYQNTISGRPDLSVEYRRLTNAILKLQQLTVLAIENGCRLNHLKYILDNESCTKSIIEGAESEKRIQEQCL
jgi:hypothetical protein